MTNNPTFAQSVRHAWQTLLRSICVLNRIQFSAPWEARRRGC
jgi:hypothetical protein